MPQSKAISFGVRPRALRGRTHYRVFLGCSLLLFAASVSHHPKTLIAPLEVARMAAPAAPKLDPVAFSDVITPEDCAAYLAAQDAQKKGDWQEANALLMQVKAPVLEPSLLAQRFLDGRARPTERALNAWLSEYPTHPKYDAVLARAAKLYPESFAALIEAPAEGKANRARNAALPANETTHRYGGAHTYAALSATDRSHVSALTEKAEARMEAGQNLPAIGNDLSPLGQYFARWEQANLLFAYGQMEEALRMAAAPADRTTETAPHLHWVAGMAAWETRNYTAALHHFGSMARQYDKLTSADAAASAFWAARAAQALGERDNAVLWLRLAARQDNAFYAHLARNALGQNAQKDTALNAHTQLFSRHQADRAWLEAQPGAKRALAWHALNQDKMAQWELAEAYETASPNDRALLAHLAGALNFTDLQLAMAQSLPKNLAVAASYPIPAWSPKSGFELDRALLLGIARQESGFNPAATSPAGASGLMQLMPQTANAMAAMQPFASNGRAGGPVSLRDPVTNLSLGQRYLQYLAAKPYVENNLILLLAAYNAGPKAAITWADRAAEARDPLAFMERISYSETRTYVQKVLANSWTYHTLLGTPSDSLQALAHGQWPLLKAGTPWRMAERAGDNARKVN